MIVHLFNSSSVSGPERLVLPALAAERDHIVIVNLQEERIRRLRESDPLEDYAGSLNLNFCGVRVSGRWDSGALHELRALLDRLDPDLVHAHDVKASAYLMKARHGARYRIISTHHGIHGRPDLKTRIYEWLYRHWVLKAFDRVLAVSNDDYETLLHSGLPHDRVRLHLNGIDGHLVAPARRSHESQSIRERWLPEESRRDSLFLMGAIGRLSSEKNHERLLGVLLHLKRLPCEMNWKCLIFGAGPLEKKLQTQAANMGLEDKVIWMGYRDHVGSELAGLNLVISLSKAEGLPINLVEAGWAGTPVMATRVGGVRDLIPDESYGISIPPEESLMESASRLKRAMSREGQRTLQDQAGRFQHRVMNEFTQKQWLTSLKELYAELGVDMVANPVRWTGGSVGRLVGVTDPLLECRTHRR